MQIKKRVITGAIFGALFPVTLMAHPCDDTKIYIKNDTSQTMHITNIEVEAGKIDKKPSMTIEPFASTKMVVSQKGILKEVAIKGRIYIDNGAVIRYKGEKKEKKRTSQETNYLPFFPVSQGKECDATSSYGKGAVVVEGLRTSPKMNDRINAYIKKS